jgi:hypothetical protein
MDSNKLAKLRDVKYKIPRTCRWCKHLGTDRVGGLTGWTTCNIHTYFRLKHKNKRHMSIHACGSCSDWEANEKYLIREFGHGWLEFLEKDI